MERAISQIDYCCCAQMPRVMPIICLLCWGQLTHPAEDGRSQGEEGGSGGCSIPCQVSKRCSSWDPFFFLTWLSALEAGIYFLGHQWTGMLDKTKFQEAKMR